MSFSKLIKEQQDYFFEGETKPYAFRLASLQKLLDALKKYESDILLALQNDLQKYEFEGYFMEIGYLCKEIRYAMKHLKKWMTPKKVKTPITHFGSRSFIYPEPYGTILILSPWNYPLQMVIAPLIGAIAAGNCAILKPSEYSPHTNKIIVKIIEEIFDPKYVTVVEGGPETAEALTKAPVDYIFFSGSYEVGKKVMRAASERLTPVTLELNGKNPAIVDYDANLTLAAKRIIWGKFLNVGQTCLAPDYVWVHESRKDEFIEKAKEFIIQFYGKEPLQKEDYGKVVNRRHFDRLKGYLDNGSVLIGGKVDEVSLKIEPTILDEVSLEDPVMQEEIFGPILPVTTFRDLDQLIRILQKRPKSLSLYYFSESKEKQEQILDSVSFGGGCINDTMMHTASEYLPFGGVGNSGFGSYHGKYSFDCFTHSKSIVKQTTKFDLDVRYPYKNNIKLIRKIWS